MQKIVVYTRVSTTNKQERQLADEIVFALDQVRSKDIGVIVGVRTNYKEAHQLAKKLGAVVVFGANNAIPNTA